MNRRSAHQGQRSLDENAVGSSGASEADKYAQLVLLLGQMQCQTSNIPGEFDPVFMERCLIKTQVGRQWCLLPAWLFVALCLVGVGQLVEQEYTVTIEAFTAGQEQQ